MSVENSIFLSFAYSSGFLREPVLSALRTAIVAGMESTPLFPEASRLSTSTGMVWCGDLNTVEKLDLSLGVLQHLIGATGVVFCELDLSNSIYHRFLEEMFSFLDRYKQQVSRVTVIPFISTPGGVVGRNLTHGMLRSSAFARCRALSGDFYTGGIVVIDKDNISLTCARVQEYIRRLYTHNRSAGVKV